MRVRSSGQPTPTYLAGHPVILTKPWRRQCKATFQFDSISTKLVDEIGVETMMWGSDYPHTDGIWPESSRYIEEQFAGLSPEIVHEITCENAAKFYNLIN